MCVSHLILEPPCYYPQFADNDSEVSIHPFPHHPVHHSPNTVLSRCSAAWALGQPTPALLPRHLTQPDVWAGLGASRPVTTPCFSPAWPPSLPCWIARQLPRLVILPLHAQLANARQVRRCSFYWPLPSKCSTAMGQGVRDRKSVTWAQNC